MFDAEKEIIGSIIVDSECIKDCDALSCEMFENQIYGKIFEECQNAYLNKKQINPAMISQNLSFIFEKDIVNEALKNAITCNFTSATIKSSVEVVLKRFKAKLLQKTLSQPIDEANIFEQLQKIRSEIDDIAFRRDKNCQNLSEIVAENKDYYFRDHTAEKTYLGFKKLDEALCGLEGGDVIVIGARPAVGKSALVTQIADNLTKKCKKVAFFNLEMHSKQMYERFLARESGISLFRIKSGTSFIQDEKIRYDSANEVLMKNTYLDIYTGSKTVSEIKMDVMPKDYDVIIIDYLQLVKTGKRYSGNRAAEVGDISKSIKQLAMDLNVPILLLSQLNRVSEGKETKEPTMSELRETGDIEQDASVIILLWNINEDRVKKGLKIDKNRQGELIKEVLVFDGSKMSFVETDETVKQAQEWKIMDTDNPFED